MEIYTLTVETIDDVTDYKRDQIIDEYESVIWTERFIEPGDFRLIFPASYRNAVLARPGTLFGCDRSRELMISDTREIADGMITVSGKTFEAFFANRVTEAENILTNSAEAMQRIVENMQGTNWAIPGLRIGLTAETFDQVFVPLKKDEVYAKLREIADKHQIGMAVYWVKREDDTHELVFSTRLGEDRTDQILFSPDLDNLANVKELYSTADSKSTVLVYPPEDISGTGELMDGIGPAEVSNLNSFNTNPLDLRVLSMTLGNIPEDEIEGADDDEKRLFVIQKMQEKAQDELKNRKKKRVVDGEITPEVQFTYYTQLNPAQDNEYRLGDSVKIAGNFTDPVIGTVTEYIQSADGTGTRAYPSVVVPADPVESNPT